MKKLIIAALILASSPAIAAETRSADCGPIGETSGKLTLTKEEGVSSSFNGKLSLENGYTLEINSSDAYRASAAALTMHLYTANKFIGSATALFESNPSEPVGIALQTGDKNYPSITCWVSK